MLTQWLQQKQNMTNFIYNPYRQCWLSGCSKNKTWQTLYKTHTDSADSVVAATTKHDKLYIKHIQTVLTQWLQQKNKHDKLNTKHIQTVLTQWLQPKKNMTNFIQNPYRQCWLSGCSKNKTWQTLYTTHTDSADSVVAAKTKHDKLYIKHIQTVLTQWLQQKKNMTNFIQNPYRQCWLSGCSKKQHQAGQT